MDIQHLVIHCSDSSYGDPELIDEWHQKRGFTRKPPLKDNFNPQLKSIGYHFLIGNGCLKGSKNYQLSFDGYVWSGRSPDEDGAHAYGLNEQALGICMVGVHVFSQHQMSSMQTLCVQWLRKLGLKPNRVIGHCETPHEKKQGEKGKTCPNINMEMVRTKIASLLAHL